ncbi:hypothetical protein P4a_00083 [Klebsiella phage VLCpiP4a]|nr:hypothetical protein P4a_00083 [Klebsiella phage VLCpiP4a]
MRKSLIMGTREDVLKSTRLRNKNEPSNRYTQQANTVAVHNTGNSVSPVSNSKRTIVTFNHPSIN